MNNELSIKTIYTYPLPLTNQQIADSQKLLNELDKQDQTRLKTIERRNYLETYLNEKREWYNSKEAHQVFFALI